MPLKIDQVSTTTKQSVDFQNHRVSEKSLVCHSYDFFYNRRAKRREYGPNFVLRPQLLLFHSHVFLSPWGTGEFAVEGWNKKRDPCVSTLICKILHFKMCAREAELRVVLENFWVFVVLPPTERQSIFRQNHAVVIHLERCSQVKRDVIYWWTKIIV